MKTEFLPFSIRPVCDRRDLDKAVAMRRQAYARHLPELAATLKESELVDHSEDVVVLLAESKLDGSILGTMRIHTNDNIKLPTEHSVDLPVSFALKRLTEATRLGVVKGEMANAVKVAFFKAYYRYCLRNQMDAMVIAGRSPLDRMYQRLLFEEVFPGLGFVNLLHAGNLPHRILFFDIHTAESRWETYKHPLFEYFIRTEHPDLEFNTTRLPVITKDQTDALRA
jgi:hypothetical protein